MSALTTKTFWADAGERAIKTFAQVAGATILASGVLGLLDLNYIQVLSISGLGSLLSLLTSIGSAGVGNSNSASLLVDTVDLETK